MDSLKCSHVANSSLLLWTLQKQLHLFWDKLSLVVDTCYSPLVRTLRSLQLSRRETKKLDQLCSSWIQVTVQMCSGMEGGMQESVYSYTDSDVQPQHSEWEGERAQRKTEREQERGRKGGVYVQPLHKNHLQKKSTWLHAFKTQIVQPIRPTVNRLIICCSLLRLVLT